MKYLENLKNYVFRPTPDSLSVGNYVYFSLCLCFGPLIGSLVSIYVIAGVLFGFWYLCWRRIQLPNSNILYFCAISFFSYILAEILSSVINPGPKNLSEILENMPFVGLVPLYALIFADRSRLILLVERAAAVAAIAGYILYLTGYVGGGYRTELMAGNSGVLAVLATVLLTINLVAIWRPGGTKSWWFIIGAVASVGLIVSSGMRVMLLAIGLVPLMISLMLGAVRLHRWTKTAILPLLLLCFAVVVLAYKPIERRISETISEITTLQTDNYSTSINQRLLMWKAGSIMIIEKPFFGHGPGNVQALMTKKTTELSGIPIGYSHFHNAVINELVRAGIFGLCALLSMFLVPFLICSRADKDDIGKAGFTILCGVQLAYVVSGLTGIMLGHDILDAVYISAVAFGLYLVFGEAEKNRLRNSGMG